MSYKDESFFLLQRTSNDGSRVSILLATLGHCCLNWSYPILSMRFLETIKSHKKWRNYFPFLSHICCYFNLITSFANIMIQEQQTRLSLHFKKRVSDSREATLILYVTKSTQDSDDAHDLVGYDQPKLRLAWSKICTLSHRNITSSLK